MSGSKQDICEIYYIDQEKVMRQKEAIYRTSELVPLFKMLADETRLKIIYILSQEEEVCVCEVASIIGSSIATASHHLRLLRNAGMATFRKDGKLAYYRLQNTQLGKIILESLQLKEKGDTINES